MQLKFDFVDKNFRITSAENYRLSIQISLNGFSFCVYDEITDKHLAIKNFVYTKNVRDEDLWVDEVIEISKSSFGGFNSDMWSNCLYLTRKNILVPKDIFSEIHIKDYMSLLFRIGEYDEIIVQYIPEFELYSCFAVPSRITMELTSWFENMKIFSQAYCGICETAKKNQKSKINVIFCENFINITVFKDNLLILNNSFEISNIADAVYFIAAVIQKNGISKVPIYVSGSITSADINRLGNYFPYLIREHNKKITLRLGLETSSKYCNLLLMHKCE